MSVPATVRASAERLVVAATMGPTVHDVHAWRFKVVAGLIELHADPDRFRRLRDPAGRALHLASGAALVNLRLTAAQLGHEAVVRLLPDAGRPALLATVRLAGRHRVTREERLLCAATLRPLSATAHPSGERPSAHVLNELREAARLEGAALHPLPTAADGAVQRAVLTTTGDGRTEWLRAGQALQRVLLSGTARSVSASFTFEAADVPSVREVTTPGEIPQALLELAQQAPVRPRGRLFEPAVDRQHEGKRNWQRIR
ncbi:nitroreductase family protein [Actinomadura montaniterrae]|nr:hypothetical protein [Actinomadura montaniterrae]